MATGLANLSLQHRQFCSFYVLTQNRFYFNVRVLINLEIVTDEKISMQLTLICRFISWKSEIIDLFKILVSKTNFQNSSRFFLRANSPSPDLLKFCEIHQNYQLQTTLMEWILVCENNFCLDLFIKYKCRWKPFTAVTRSATFTLAKTFITRLKLGCRLGSS